MMVLKHFIYIQYGCGMQLAVVYSLNHDPIWAPPNPNIPKFGHHLHRYNSVRMHPCAHPQHMKVLKHFIYIQYGCGMQSAVVYSLNHDTTMSFLVPPYPNFPRVGHHLHRYKTITV
jgi:hypothetical protein